MYEPSRNDKMILGNTGGDSFELYIERYQFADEPKLGGDDLQWLYIAIRGSLSGRRWKSTDPSLTFNEAKRLASWFRQLAVGEQTEMEEDFTEPNVSFEVVGKQKGVFILRVYLELESRPPWKPSNTRSEDDWHQVYVDLVVRSQELLQASDSILTDLRSLPPRRGMSL